MYLESSGQDLSVTSVFLEDWLHVMLFATLRPLAIHHTNFYHRTYYHHTTTTILTATSAECVVNAGSQVLSMMSVFLNEVAPCLPPHYSPMDTFAEVFQDELVPAIEGESARSSSPGMGTLPPSRR